MNRNLKLGLVIPTLAEAANLPELLSRLRAVLDGAAVPFEILIVDDNSRDGTVQLVEEISSHDPRVRLLVRKHERGLAGAVLHGWQHTDADILAVMDADLQHPPELLPELLDAVLRGSDLAIASRYAPGGSLGRWNPLRRLASALAVALSLPLQPRHRRAADPMSGYFLVRRHCVPAGVLQPHGFKLLLEILARGSFATVCEVPFAFGKRRAGSSKARLKVAIQYLALLARLYADRLQRVGVAPASAD